LIEGVGSLGCWDSNLTIFEMNLFEEEGRYGKRRKGKGKKKEK